MTLNRILSLAAASAALLVALAPAARADSPWSIRLRATYLQPVNESDAFSALGIAFPRNAVHVNDKYIPEIDVDYAINTTFYSELVLTIPQTQDVTLQGVGALGSFKHLPPTLYVGYKANPGGTVRPYVALGVNYTLIWGDSLSVAGVPLHLDTHSIGPAAQAGLDWAIAKQWSFNVDLKKAYIRSDVYAGGTSLTQARLDPWLYSLGLTYQF